MLSCSSCSSSSSSWPCLLLYLPLSSYLCYAFLFYLLVILLLAPGYLLYCLTELFDFYCSGSAISTCFQQLRGDPILHAFLPACPYSCSLPSQHHWLLLVNLLFKLRSASPSTTPRLFLHLLLRLLLVYY